jgi:hypothetical protein
MCGLIKFYCGTSIQTTYLMTLPRILEFEQGHHLKPQSWQLVPSTDDGQRSVYFTTIRCVIFETTVLQ